MKKRIVSILLAVVMVVGMIPAGVITAFAETTSKTITANETINGGTFSGDFGSGHAVTISGNNVTEVTFNDVTFENITSTGNGGAVYVDVAGKSLKLTFNRCKFINCSANYGGAVYLKDVSSNNTVTFNGCVALDCKANNYGGFLYIEDKNTKINEGLNATDNYTVVSNCSATYGGGVYAADMTLLKNFVFDGNKATKYGGGMYNNTGAGPASVTENCLFYRNSVSDKYYGGGLYVNDSDGTVRNCRFVENIAKDTQYGGDLYTNTSIEGCTVVSNYTGVPAVYSEKGNSGYTVKAPSNCKLNEVSGTEADPYKIESTDDWDALYYAVKGGNTFDEIYIKLENDIVAVNPIGKWISDADKTKAFQGTFDGNGHTVTLYLSNGDSNNAAFNFTNGATVKNLTVTGYVKGNSGAAGIISHAENTTVENCKNNAEIVGTDYVGGIIGWAENTNITTCENYSTVRATNRYAGGLVGNITGGKVLNGLSCGEVTAKQYAGGILGFEKNAVTVQNCHSFGNVSADSNVGAITGNTASYSTYECCAYDKDGCANSGCPENNTVVGLSHEAMWGEKIEMIDGKETVMPQFANNYIRDNGKAGDGWLRIAFDDDKKPYFIQNNAVFGIDKHGLGRVFSDYPEAIVINNANNPDTLGSAEEARYEASAKKTTYIVTESVTHGGRIKIVGDVLLIIKDGCEYTVNGGIELDTYTTSDYQEPRRQERTAMLTVTSESLGSSMGKLTATAITDGDAAIGGNVGDPELVEIENRTSIITNVHHGGTLNIFGGNVTANGNCKDSVAVGGGAGIQYDFWSPVLDLNPNVEGGNGCTVNMYNGILDVTAGENAVGIGGGKGFHLDNSEKVRVWNGDGGNGGKFNFYGGTVTARSDVAAFGKGLNGDGTDSDRTAAQNNIKINTNQQTLIRFGDAFDSSTGAFGENINVEKLNQNKYGMIFYHSEHKYEIKYEFSDDYSKCTAMEICQLCFDGVEGYIGETQTVDVAIVHTDATCTEKGYMTYTAVFDAPFETQKKVIEDENATGHTWTNAEQNKAGISSLKSEATCVANAVYNKVCSVCDAISTTETWTKSGTATGEHKWENLNGVQHNCSVCGAIEDHEGTGTCSKCGGDICEHDKSTIDYYWNDTYTKCTAKVICDDCSTVLYAEETSNITGENNPSKTCRVQGTKVFLATFATLGTDTVTVPREYGPHSFSDGECTVCHISEDMTDFFYIKNIGSVAVAVTWSAANLKYSIGDKYSFADFGGTLTLWPGEICYFRGTNDDLNGKTLNCNVNAALAVGGDIGTLLNGNGNVAEYPDNAFSRLFFGLQALTDINDLKLCNKNTILGNGCFNGMFYGCTGLTSVPDDLLPATTLAEMCYDGMFYGCTGLTSVPDDLLPATTLAKMCYINMFNSCTNLTNAPELPATTLEKKCYSGMFDQCPNLSRIKLGFTEWGNNGNHATLDFLPSYLNSGITLTIYCPYELDTATRNDYRIPEGISVRIIKPFLVEFDMNGCGEQVRSQTVYPGEKVTKPTDPVAEGYVFAGWYKDAECVTPWDFDTDTVTENTTIYAKWIAGTAVQLVSIGGSGGQTRVYAFYGDVMLTITVPTRAGYVFDGYCDFNGVKYYNADGTSAKNWDKDTGTEMLIAVWLPESTGGHTHTFADTYSHNDTHHWHVCTCEYAECGSLVDGFGEHTWERVNDETHKCSVCDAVENHRFSDGVCACGEPETYTVAFDVGDGDNAPEPQQKKYGKALYLSKTIPTSEGGQFVGWATDPKATVPQYLPGGRYTAEGDATLYAVWSTTESELLSVLFDYSFDDPGKPLNADKVFLMSGEKVAEPPKPELFAARFLGWVTADGELFDFDTPITENITLYAMWDIGIEYMDEWIMTIPEGLKDILENNDLSGYGELDDLINKELIPQIFDSDDSECKTSDAYRLANAALYLDMTQILYVVTNVDGLIEAGVHKSPYDIIEAFLKSRLIFDDFAKLIYVVQSQDTFKIMMAVLESHPDFVASIKKAMQEEYGDNEDSWVLSIDLYFEALKAAVEADDASLLIGSITPAVHEHTFADTYSHNDTHHWKECTCEDDACKGNVTDFGEHTFDEGVVDGNKTTYTCKCGYTKVVYDKPDDEGEIVTGVSYTGISLTLGSDISINFYMNLTDEARQNGTMTFNIGGRIVTVDGKDAKYNSTEKKYYFSTPLTALEMAETVTATFTYNGIDYVQEYSVEQYIDAILNGTDKDGNPYSDEMKLLARKIANYGYYAQIYLESIHTNVHIVDPYAEPEKGYDRVEPFGGKFDINTQKAIEALKNYKVTVSGTSDNLSLYGSTVYFDAATALNYYVTVKNGVEPTAKAVNTVTGEEKQVEIKLYKGNIYIVSVKDITATELADDITVTINGEITLTGSVFAYCNAVMTKDGQTDAAKNAMAAFYEYYKTAVDYAKTQG